jgi:endosialidase-like protein
MGIFDIFTNDVAQQAASQQITGINQGVTAATGNINQGIGALNTDYTAALKPFTENYGTANAGTTQLGNVLGLNGQPGSDAALTALRNTPGYQFQQQSQDATVNAQAAATGMNASGNQLLALNKVNQGLADSTYNNYVSQLQPYLGASNSAASGIAGVNTGLGNATASQYGNLANLNYTAATGIGNANANATLAQNQANQNQWNAVMGVGTAALGMFSDVRLKEDAAKVGELYDGQEIYRYRYIGSPVWQIGLMAQDVEKVEPDAVSEVGGYKMVRYDKATQYASDLSRFLEAA